jgi:hypothetical protein
LNSLVVIPTTIGATMLVNRYTITLDMELDFLAAIEVPSIWKSWMGLLSALGILRAVRLRFFLALH